MQKEINGFSISVAPSSEHDTEVRAQILILGR